MRAYVQNPKDHTYSGELSAISRMMKLAATSESPHTKDSLLSIIDRKADLLMGDLIQYGNKTPVRAQKNQTLKGCTPAYREMINSNYCWQAYLTDEETPVLFVANKNNGTYAYELIQWSDS